MHTQEGPVLNGKRIDLCALRQGKFMKHPSIDDSCLVGAHAGVHVAGATGTELHDGIDGRMASQHALTHHTPVRHVERQHQRRVPVGV